MNISNYLRGSILELPQIQNPQEFLNSGTFHTFYWLKLCSFVDLPGLFLS